MRERETYRDQLPRIRQRMRERQTERETYRDRLPRIRQRMRERQTEREKRIEIDYLELDRG